jgi:hypothetical protein
VLAACKDLSESQLLAKIPGAYGHIRETFGHLLAAEADYIGRITGTRPQPPFKWEDGPTLRSSTATVSPPPKVTYISLARWKPLKEWTPRRNRWGLGSKVVVRVVGRNETRQQRRSLPSASTYATASSSVSARPMAQADASPGTSSWPCRSSTIACNGGSRW